MPRNLRNQHNGRERCTDHGYQKCRHGNKHDITDILLPDNAIPHSYQTDNLSQQPSRNQRRNETAARQSGRDRENGKDEMQQHDSRHPHNLRTAVLCLGQQKLLPASSQIDLHQRNDVGHQHQIEHLDIRRRIDFGIHMPESIHGGGVELPAYGDNHRQYQEILHLDKEGENRFRYFYQMVRIHRKDHACHGSCHNTRQQGSDGRLRGIEAFNGFYYNERGSQWRCKSRSEPRSRPGCQQLFLFAFQDMSPAGYQATHIRAYLHGRPFAPQRQPRRAGQNAPYKLGYHLDERMPVSDAPVNHAACLRNTSPADKRHFPHEPHDEDENAPRKQKEWNVPVPGRMRSEETTAEVEQIIEKIVIGHSDQSRQQTDEHADEIQPGIHQLQLPDVPAAYCFPVLDPRPKTFCLIP